MKVPEFRKLINDFLDSIPQDSEIKIKSASGNNSVVLRSNMMICKVYGENTFALVPVEVEEKQQESFKVIE